VRCRVFASVTEGLFRAVGLTALFGSPVILKLVRDES